MTKKFKTTQIYGIKFEDRIVYVGQTTKTLGARLTVHEGCARRGLDDIPKLYKHMRANGFAGYEIIYISECAPDIARKVEKYFIDKYDTMKNGLNSDVFRDSAGREKGCANPSGAAHYAHGDSNATAKAWHASVAVRRGKKLSPEHREKVVAALKRADPYAKAIGVRDRASGKTWRSIKDAAKEIGCSNVLIAKHIKGAYPNVPAKLRSYDLEFIE